MQKQLRGDTGPELLLRRALHGLGLRYRLHARPVPSLRCRVDIVFRRAMIAVEVRGCFWHACRLHGTLPKANAAWWREKLRLNRVRDARTARALSHAGWLLVVVWEHDDVPAAAAKIRAAVVDRTRDPRA